MPVELFRPTGTTPDLPTGPTAFEPIEVAFSDDLDPASVVAGQVRAVTTMGAELAILFNAVGDTIVVQPPMAGWGSEAFVLELHRDLRAVDGRTLATPLALPFTPR